MLSHIRSFRQKDEAQLDQRNESAGQTCTRVLSLLLLILLLLHHSPPSPLDMTLAVRSTPRRTSREPGVMDGEGGNWGHVRLCNVSGQRWHEIFFFFSHPNVSGKTKPELSEEVIGFNGTLAPCLQPSTKPPDLASCYV